MVFEKEIRELKQIFATYSNEELDAELESFLIKFDEDSQQYAKEND